jgi:large subunit ribosomal protein L11
METTKLKKGSSEPNRNKVATMSWDAIKTIAEDKLPDMNCFTVDSAMRMVAGTARSMGVIVKGGDAPLSK